MTDPITVHVGTQLEIFFQFLVDEVQLLTPSGAPTGGTVDAGHRGKVAPLIRFDSTALDMQEALCQLPNVGPNGVICWGGPWPTAGISVKFIGHMVGKRNHPPITITNNLTGGTFPNITVTTPQPGGLIEPSTVTGFIAPKDGASVALTVDPQGGQGVWKANYTPTVDGLHTARAVGASPVFGTVEAEQVFTAVPRVVASV